MISLFNLKKSAIIIHAAPAYPGVYLGIDSELERVLKEALEKHDVVVEDTISQKTTCQGQLDELDNVLATLQYPQDTALRCVILMLR